MGNICVIGPRASGKTTYLAALAYWENHQIQRNKGKGFHVQPLNDESRNLAEKAEDIILQGLSVEPTVIGDAIQTVDDLDYYSTCEPLNLIPVFSSKYVANLCADHLPNSYPNFCGSISIVFNNISIYCSVAFW